MYRFKLPIWVLGTAFVLASLNAFEPLEAQMAFALTGLFAAVFGTVLYGEERLPFVAGGGLVILIAGNVTDFHHLIEGMEWVLFIKLVCLLTWVDYLNESKFFDYLIEKYLPRRLHGYKLLVVLLVLCAISAALIDEVNSIVLMYAVTLAIVGYTVNGTKHLRLPSPVWTAVVIFLVSATNIGSQLLPLGNPVGIAVAVIAEPDLTVPDFLLYAWVPAFIVLGYYIFRLRMKYPQIIEEFTKVSVEDEDFATLAEMPHEIEIVEYSSDEGHAHHKREHKQPSPRTLGSLFAFGLVGLLSVQPIAMLAGYPPADALGIFVLVLFAVTLYVASHHNESNEALLSSLPYATLLFIVMLFGIAHGLESSGFTDLVAREVFGLTGDNQILLRVGIIVIGAVVTAFMDNVIAVAVLAPIIIALGEMGVDTRGLWFQLLGVAVIAGNLTPIGSAANILANDRIRASWGVWWRYAGQLALECLLVHAIALYVWEQVLSLVL
ncbi:MAG: Citrate transporter [candidate division WS6 bacterium OLB20]|uniref:Citrate transporter n=1 Tax=candidate division WS6 bacterium OLB20 TaxID=1617426 RepID=A0A136M0Y6_9BACT|nr:MAG: Citrate transporter [candidate division WS6 bacterium OLB20]